MPAPDDPANCPTNAGSREQRPSYSPFFDRFALEPGGVFLNHGSFGAAPRAALLALDEVRARIEAEPVRFFVREMEPLLDAARARMAAFVACDPEGFAFVRNATEGVSTVVRSLRLSPGDELLTSDHEYNACNNALDVVAARAGARVVRAGLPWPVRSEQEVIDALLAACTPRTRLALVSHITSPTALVLPVERIIPVLAARGIDVLIDGAHAPGHLPLNVAALGDLGCAYYTGNFHKWVCAPKGSAFLWARADRRADLIPLSISHGFNSARRDRTRFRLLFDFAGTCDPSAWLATPAAMDEMARMVPGGWPEVMRRNRALALEGRAILNAALGGQPSCPESMVGCMATTILPERSPAEAAMPTAYHDPLQDRLIARWGIQVPIIPFPAPPRRHVRIAAQVYNTLDQVRYLARALQAEVAQATG